MPAASIYPVATALWSELQDRVDVAYATGPLCSQSAKDKILKILLQHWLQSFGFLTQDVIARGLRCLVQSLMCQPRC